MRKLAKRPDPKPQPAAKAHVSPAPQVQRQAPPVSTRDEDLAADRMAALVMRRAYASEKPAASARGRKPSDAGRIRRAAAPGIQEEAVEVSKEVVSRAPLALASTVPLPVVDDAEEASEEVEAEELLDPSAFKIRAMYTRLIDVGIPEDEVGELLDLYGAHLAKGGSDEEFLEWIRSHYVAKTRSRRSRGKGSSKRRTKSPAKAAGKNAKTGTRQGSKKAATKGTPKAASKGSGQTAVKPAAKATKASPAGKIKARTDKKSGS